MTISKPMMRSLAAAALLTAGAAQAAVVMYTDEAAWQAAVSQIGHDYFADLSPGALGVSYLERQTLGVPYSYSVSSTLRSARPDMRVAGTQTDHWISTSDPDATLFLGPGQGVTAIALYGVTSDTGGSPAPGNGITVYACSSDLLSCATDDYVTTIGDSDFRGFISLNGVGFVGLRARDGAAFASISEVRIGSAVPEPGTYALTLAALGGVGLLARRRRAS